MVSIAGLNVINAQQSASIFKSRIDTLNNNIYRYFYDSANSLFYETNKVTTGEKRHSYLWPLCALIQASNEAETINPGKTYMAPVMKAIDQYYSSVAPLPAYQAYVTKEKKDSRFFDDNQWIAISMY